MLLTSDPKAKAMRIMKATNPPMFMRKQMVKQSTNAIPAVMNHPPMTVRTPVTRKTALSRPQARSARDAPIATMNVTYVVLSGSLREVPRAMRSGPT